MGSLFVAPLTFAPIASTAAVSGSSASNTNIDVAGMVYRTATNCYVIIDLGGNYQYDTLALIGTNLRPVDTVRVQTGGTNSGTGGWAGTQVQAYTGYRPPLSSSTTIVRFATRNERFVRIDISAGQLDDGAATPTVTRGNHPDGYVQIQRIVVGKAISTLGIETDADFGFEDSSTIMKGPGYRFVQDGDVLPSIKFATSWITDLSWRTEWVPFFQQVGNKRAVLMVIEESTPETWQTDVFFGPIVTRGSMKAQHHNAKRFEGTIETLSL